MLPQCRPWPHQRDLREGVRQRAKLKQERCDHWEADKALRKSSRIDEEVEIPGTHVSLH